MDWVKRNLYFVVGSAVVLLLLGLAGFYLYRGWSANHQIAEKLSGQYAELKRLYNLDPNPGSDKINNIKAAREQQEELRQFLQQTRTHFAPVPSLPAPHGTNRVTSEEFTSALRRTVDQLQRDATNASVALPPQYNFSFEAQKGLMTFSPGSLDLLAVQLGEVKAICQILFAAKVNALDNIRRERVSPDDQRGPPSDYLVQKSATNSLAIMTPYEITFRCFSGELGAVLDQLHASPYCLLAKTLDVGPASALAMEDPNAPYYGVPGAPGALPGYPPPAEIPPAGFAERYGAESMYAPRPVTPTPAMPLPRYPVGGSAAEAPGAGFAQRYPGAGVESMGAGPVPGGIPYRPLGSTQPGAPGVPGMPAYAPPPVMPATPGLMPGATPRGGMQAVLNEKLLRVTLLIHVVKLLPQETNR